MKKFEDNEGDNTLFGNPAANQLLRVDEQTYLEQFRHE